jgi:peptidoglycan/LPS O-acetylase OafA/YrhL
MLLYWVGVLLVTLGLHWLILKYLPYTHDRVGWEYGVIGGAKDWMPRFSPISFFAIYALGVLAAGAQLSLPKGPRLGYDIIILGGLAIAARALQVNMYNPIEGYGFLGIPYKFPWFPLGVAIVLAALPGSIIFNRIADNGLVAFLARISFGLYLWHFLVLVLLGRYWLPGARDGGITSISEWLTVAGADFAISVVIATLSFYLLEQPIIRWARRFEGRLKPAPARSLREAEAA